MLSILPFLFYEQNGITILIANIGLEIDFLNGIKLYTDMEAIEQITRLVNKFLSI